MVGTCFFRSFFLFCGPVTVGDSGPHYILCDGGCLTAARKRDPDQVEKGRKIVWREVEGCNGTQMRSKA
jgi:hypothetical protein